jgi:tetratricopeptide (TPR) repeat protein
MLGTAPAAYAEQASFTREEPSAEAADTMPAPASSILPANVAGSYLASYYARTNGKIDQAIESLKRVHAAQPENASVAVQLQGMFLLNGRIDEAAALAQEIKDAQVHDPLSDLLLVLHAVKNNDMDSASIALADASEEGNIQLWVPLLTGWIDVDRGSLSKPLTLEAFTPDIGRAAPLVNYHMALINTHAGFIDVATNNFKDAIENPKDPPQRIMKMLIRFYNDHEFPQALKPIVNAYLENASDEELESSKPSPVASIQDGVAEVLYTMGGIMYGAGVVNDAAIYLQLAAYIKPDLMEGQLALGDAYAELQQYEQSNRAYDNVTPDSDLYIKAQMHIAVNYDRMGRLKDGLALLDNMIRQSPDASDALITKGDLLRIHARYEEAVAAYTEALGRIPELKSGDWPILFARGSCLERQGKWPEAEKDLQAALALKPDQPDILNYLGFAQLERGSNIEMARAMIAKAVKARPNDAQIIDSMGWVLYMQGDYTGAMAYLEKAVELLPSDPTVNDHLGDVYWRLGRKTEARFQWERSLSFSPDAKLVESIERKLKDGLPHLPAMAATTPPVAAPADTDAPLVAATQ